MGKTTDPQCIEPGASVLKIIARRPISQETTIGEIARIMFSLRIMFRFWGKDQFVVSLRDALWWADSDDQKTVYAYARKLKAMNGPDIYFTEGIEYIEVRDPGDARRKEMMLSVGYGFRLLCMQFFSWHQPAIRKYYATLDMRLRKYCEMEDKDHALILDGLFSGKGTDFNVDMVPRMTGDIASVSRQMPFVHRINHAVANAQRYVAKTYKHTFKMYAVDYYKFMNWQASSDHKKDDLIIPKPQIGEIIDGEPLEPCGNKYYHYWFQRPSRCATHNDPDELPPWVIKTVCYIIPYDEETGLDFLIEWLVKHTECRHFTKEEWLANPRLRVAELVRNSLLTSANEHFAQSTVDLIRKKSFSLSLGHAKRKSGRLDI